jgi:hypothetical protein
MGIIDKIITGVVLALVIYFLLHVVVVGVKVLAVFLLVVVVVGAAIKFGLLKDKDKGGPK